MKTNPSDSKRWKKFVELTSRIKGADELHSFFELFLTHEEKEVIGARLDIIQALLEGKLTQREIAEQYGVSISQITRGSNALKIADPQTVQFLKK